MAMVEITVSQLSCRLRVDPYSNVIGTYVNLSGLERELLEWERDPRTRRGFIKRRWFHYDAKNMIKHYPRFMLPEICRELELRGVLYVINNIQPTLGAPMRVSMRDSVSDVELLQTEVIAHITQDLPETFPFFRPVEMQTGRGKTYTSIKAAVKLGRRTLIIAADLINQWVASVKEFTTATDDDIIAISGCEKFTTAVRDIKSGKSDPSFIIVSSKTFTDYVRLVQYSSNIPRPDQLPAALGYATRITDEIQKGFFSNVMADLQLEDRFIIPLTATYMQNNDFAERFMSAHYPPNVRFGGHDVIKYTDVFGYRYFDTHGQIPERAVIKSRGYSHVEYEKYLLKHINLLNRIYVHVIAPLFEKHYVHRERPNGTKCLFLCSTIEMCEWLGKNIIRDYGGGNTALKTLVFVNGIKREETQRSDIDVIVSTPQGMGTGADVKRLVTTIATTCVNSRPLNVQMLGRTRLNRHEEMDYHFVHICNRQVATQVKYYTAREEIFGPLAKSMTLTDLPFF